MIHHGRLYSQAVIAETATHASVAELARKLCEQSWVLCQGFRLGSFVFLNDSFSEDGAQEYAVFDAAPNPDETHSQIESVTFGWMTPAEGMEYLLKLYGLPSSAPAEPDGSPVVVAKSINDLTSALGESSRPRDFSTGPTVYARHIIKPHPQGSCWLCQ